MMEYSENQIASEWEEWSQEVDAMQLNPASKEKLRQKISDDVEAFLGAGGEIQHIERGVVGLSWEPELHTPKAWHNRHNKRIQENKS